MTYLDPVELAEMDKEIIYGHDGNHGMGWDEAEMHFCEACECEITELEASGTEFCEDCLCDDDDCEGCFYCLSTAGYDEAKADGTLKTEPTE